MDCVEVVFYNDVVKHIDRILCLAVTAVFQGSRVYGQYTRSDWLPHVARNSFCFAGGVHSGPPPRGAPWAALVFQRNTNSG